MTQSPSSTATDLPPAGPGRLPPTADGRMRFDIDEYYQLAEIGVLTEDDHVELIHGEIVNKWPENPNDRRRRFTRAEYDRMIETGFLRKEDRVELLDGEILVMSPIGPGQGELITILMEHFIRSIPDTITCRVQLPIGLEQSEPEPDIVLVRRKQGGYRDVHPGPGDVLLVVEVSHTSILYDRGPKMQSYAHAGIVEYWVADLNRDVMIVHQDPDMDAGEYRSVQQYGDDTAISPQAIPDCHLDLGWLFN